MQIDNKITVQASYVLFDSWSGFPVTIKKVYDQGIHVIRILKSMPRVYYGYEGQTLTLNSLYKVVRKKKIFSGMNDQGEEVKAKVLFVRDRRNKKKWLALLSTDLDLSDEEIIRIYGKRWDIEVFFKMTKSYLRLAKKFQGRSYDMMVAHTSIVFARYMLLALESRETEDPRTLGSMSAVTNWRTSNLLLPSSCLMDLFKAAVQKVLVLTEEKFQELFDKFISSLPNVGYLGVRKLSKFINKV